MSTAFQWYVIVCTMPAADVKAEGAGRRSVMHPAVRCLAVVDGFSDGSATGKLCFLELTRWRVFLARVVTVMSAIMGEYAAE